MATKNWYPSLNGGDGVHWSDPNNWDDDDVGGPGHPTGEDIANCNLLNNQSIEIDEVAVCGYMTFAGTTGCSLTINYSLTVHTSANNGTLSLVTGMTISGNRSLVDADVLTDPDNWFTQYTVTASELNGNISSTNPLTVYNHENAAFTIAPDSGYIYDAIDNTSGSYGSIGWSSNTLTFTDVHANSAARVKFKIGLKVFGVSCSKAFGVACSKIHGI